MYKMVKELKEEQVRDNKWKETCEEDMAYFKKEETYETTTIDALMAELAGAHKALINARIVLDNSRSDEAFLKEELQRTKEDRIEEYAGFAMSAQNGATAIVVLNKALDVMHKYYDMQQAHSSMAFADPPSAKDGEQPQGLEYTTGE